MLLTSLSSFVDYLSRCLFFIISIYGKLGRIKTGTNLLGMGITRAAVVHLNFRARATFLGPVCTVPSSMDRTSRYTKVDAR